MASEFLASVLLVDAMRDIGMLSSQDESATTPRLLGHLNRERRVWLAKLMMSVREGYNKTAEEVDVESGATRVRIPSAAVGAKIDKLEVSNGSGGWAKLNETSARTQGDSADSASDGQWYFLDNHVYFVSALASASTVRFTYVRRSNRIVDADDTREVSTFGATTVTLAGSDVPADFLTTATTYDIIQGTPHFDVIATGVSATRSGQVLTFASGVLPDELVAGDYVAISGETPIVQAPVELQDVLCYRAVFQYLRSIGDQKAELVKQDLMEMEQAAISILTPRAEGHDRFVINYNAPGWGRFIRRRR